MSAVIEGDIIAAPSSGEMTAWKSRIAALETSDPERAELEITDANHASRTDPIFLPITVLMRGHQETTP